MVSICTTTVVNYLPKSVELLLTIMSVRRDLFSVLAQQLQSADVLASHRVFMVLFRTLKELSTKRLSVDQRNYAEVFDLQKPLIHL